MSIRTDRDPDRIDKYVTDDYVFESFDDARIVVSRIGSRAYVDQFVPDEFTSFQTACHLWIMESAG